MIFEYLSSNTTYLIIMVSAIVLCVGASLLKSLLVKKIKWEKKEKIDNTESEKEN